MAHVRYAALSYCWGDTKPLVTISSNIKTHYQGITSTDLPQTLQDALRVAKALGLNYLWVDQLCIVQDDPEEWALESEKMGQVYAEAWVVLAATVASDCAQGFLRARDEPLTWGPTQIGRGSSKIRARRTPSHRVMYRSSWMHYPLFKRGWCMQELQLAHRVVHFLADQMMFQCSSSTKCECGLTAEEDNVFDKHLTAFRTLMNSEIESVPDFGFHWSIVVEEYSALALSHQTDKLPALAGLAQHMERFNPGHYIAGLWEKDIVYMLGWC
jgi:hypothetical protein